MAVQTWVCDRVDTRAEQSRAGERDPSAGGPCVGMRRDALIPRLRV